MSYPTLYVQAGPNGSGKSTSYDLYLPKGTPFINTDTISAQIKKKYPYLSNTQEQANAEAAKLFYAHIKAKATYGFETNLNDVETWKFIEKHKVLGYEINMNFFTVDKLDTLNERIKLRVAAGGHFVRPDIVEERYLAAHNLLEHYINIPHTLNVIDSSSEKHNQILTLKKGVVVQKAETLPERFEVMLEKIEGKLKGHRSIGSTVEEVKLQYQKKKAPKKGKGLGSGI